MKTRYEVKPKEVRQAEPYNPLICPCCKTETMVTIQILSKRGPPKSSIFLKNQDLTPEKP